jgi:ferritin-like metal-binding protein YciE
MMRQMTLGRAFLPLHLFSAGALYNVRRGFSCCRKWGKLIPTLLFRTRRNSAPLSAFTVCECPFHRRRTAMTVKTMEDLFVETLKDIYYAEKHILKALPAMVKKAGDKKLKDALETHRQETEGQVDRLEQVFKMMEVPARGKKCEAIEGIISEAKEHMQDIEDPEVLDAGIVGSAQAVEHYEITRYGTLIAWAKQLGRDDTIELLEANLEEEKNADMLLTKIAETAVNEKAAA